MPNWMRTIIQKVTTRRIIPIVPGIVVIGIAIVARLAGLLQLLELKTFDLFLRLRPPESMDERIVIIGINSADIAAMGGDYPISDRAIAELLTILKEYQPAAIGLNPRRDLPVEPGNNQLKKVFEESPNLIVAEKILPPRFYAPPGIPSEQVGFTDYPFDADYQARRGFLGMPDPQELEIPEAYKFSFALQLARVYLQEINRLSVEEGIRDSDAMRFETTEFPRLFPNSGGYVNADGGGVKILLNYRNNPKSFRTLSFSDLKTGNLNPDWLRDRVAIIGIVDPNFKGTIDTSAIAGLNPPGTMNGVEYQAHAVSQMISAVNENRTLLNVRSEGEEYLWIVAWGMCGILLGRYTRSFKKNLIGIGLATTALISVSYVLFLEGWWIPVIPALLVLIPSNFACITVSYYDKTMRARISERQQRIDERQHLIERTFNIIHNGPLQTLASILRRTQDKNLSQERLLLDLQNLNREIRAIGDRLEGEILTQEDSLYLGSQLKFDLNQPIHELFYQVYSITLERDLPYFENLKIKSRNFDPILNCNLNSEKKRVLCQFLEESLLNVGKHAKNVTCLWVTGAYRDGFYTLRIKDNGSGIHPKAEGRGTQQGKKLEKQLKGKFKRESLNPRGFLCEFTWLT
ncbi:CHASE2 domain-containing protein [Lusitaniella coriacea]|uniref:sensor histidine kinase n=1 Tax=Lusitaniella coriacea TaxID=1983105 RepID=UPI003CE7A966